MQTFLPQRDFPRAAGQFHGFAKLKFPSLFVAAGFLTLGITLASAGEVTFFVGGNIEKAKQLAATTGGKATKENVTKAFGWAAEALADGTEKTVVVKIAAGEYVGEYNLPAWNAPRGTVRIEGGYDEMFSKRDPFRTPTRFLSSSPRAQAMLQFSRKDQVKAFILDGILFDGAPGNQYDTKTNSLLKGQSCTLALLRFDYVTTDLIAIQNCVFMNTAHRAFETLIMTASAKAEFRIRNSIFMNCLIPVKFDSARQKTIPARMVVDHCSFLVNFAFNPDPDTSNPAALELGGKYAAREILIQDSLFYANFGGAIMNIETVPTKVTIKNNNFVGNGLLHGLVDVKAAALIAGRKQPYPVNKIVDEEEDPTLAGNVSIAPGLPIELGNPKAIDPSKVQAKPGWENEVARLLGRPLQGTNVSIKDFAPRKEYDPANPPFPTVEAAKKYGASPDVAK